MVDLTMSDEEFERQYRAAQRRGRQTLHHTPRAQAAHYDPASKRIIIEFLNRSTFTFPVELVQGLGHASDEDLAEIRLLAQGLALDWPRLDVQLSIAGLLAGQFGTKAWMSELERTGILRSSSAA
ncbi:MAG: DUF2442 domain-containing protein [Anaerolineae bacterium]|nr:DUF2442 domain-containing protein [Anaerolineae bacterium]